MQLVDIESAFQIQLAQRPGSVGGDDQLGAAAEQAVLHLYPQQILQIGLGPAEGQPLLPDLAAQGERGGDDGAIKVELALAIQSAPQVQRAGLIGGVAQGAQGELQSRDRPWQRLAAAGLGQLELTAADAGLLELPAPGFGGRLFGLLRRFARRLGGGLRDQQIAQIQLLFVIEYGRDGRGLDRDGIDAEGLLVAIEPDAGQGELVEAGKLGALGALELPVVHDQLAL
ncbi:hypothetical protein D3C79_631920 [compost metagenome]